MEAEKYLRRAIALAGKALGSSFPNPLVGAVLVAGGKIVGEGFHRGAGSPHAEIEALEQAGERARGATLFLNLEPCCHFGRTPPCCSAIRGAGVSRVVFSTFDPDERVRGNGAKALKEYGVEVGVGCLADEAVELNLPYIHRCMTGRPFILLKLASTLDGRLTAGDGRRLTGEESRKYVHYLRSWTEGLAVGIGTIEKDDPLLDRRFWNGGLPPPARMIFDSKLRFPADHEWLRRGERVIIYCIEGSETERSRALVEAGAEVVLLPAGEKGVALSSWIEDLSEKGFTSVLVEGGGCVSTSIIREGLVDRLVLFYAPLVSGSDGVSWFRESGPPAWFDRGELLLRRLERMGQDVMLVYDSRRITDYADILTEESRLVHRAC